MAFSLLLVSLINERVNIDWRMARWLLFLRLNRVFVVVVVVVVRIDFKRNEDVDL